MVTFILPKAEMGQGPLTSLSQLLADELDAAHSALHLPRIRPAAAAAIHPLDPHGLMPGVGRRVAVLWAHPRDERTRMPRGWQPSA